MLDFPGKTACILWTAGCDFRCGYCHNPEFVLPELLKELKDTFIPREALFSFLNKRRGKLEGVVISGGEPTMHKDLPVLIREIKDMGFAVKLDTNGNNPFMVKELIDAKLIDYVAMDIKTGLATYTDLVGCRAKPAMIEMTAEVLKKHDIPFEFRSTLIKEVHTNDILDSMRPLVHGADHLYLQTFRGEHTLDPAFRTYTAFSHEEMREIAKTFASVVQKVSIRSA